MEWLKAYKDTTFKFWCDNISVTAEQLVVFGVLFSTSLYLLFVKITGDSEPQIKLQNYIFAVIAVHVIAYYIFGDKNPLINQKYLKLIRLLILHMTLTLLLLVSFISLGFYKHVNYSLVFVSLFVSIMLGFHTRRVHKIENKNQGLILILIAGVSAFISCLSVYYFILPDQS